MYLNKTGNNWEDRKNFQKFPNKFFPLEIDYGQVSSFYFLFYKSFGLETAVKESNSSNIILGTRMYS